MELAAGFAPAVSSLRERWNTSYPTPALIVGGRSRNRTGLHPICSRRHLLLCHTPGECCRFPPAWGTPSYDFRRALRKLPITRNRRSCLRLRDLSPRWNAFASRTHFTCKTASSSARLRIATSLRCQRWAFWNSRQNSESALLACVLSAISSSPIVSGGGGECCPLSALSCGRFSRPVRPPNYPRRLPRLYY